MRLQSDERLIAFIRRGNMAAFEVLMSRYEARLLAFCRHMLGSREDAEDVLQEAMAAAYNAILADDRPINVRPWLYRIARNRSLNHLRRTHAITVDSMDHHLSEFGASTADKVDEREEFRLLVGDIHELPETQKTALVLREMDAMSYEQIAEAMETTVSSVKSLLVRARVSLAEAAEARLMSCNEVRIELAEVEEGLQKRPNPLVRRHLRNCDRCSMFRQQLKQTDKALAALLPLGPLAMLRKVVFAHLGHTAGTSATAAGSSAGAASAAGAAGAAGGVASSAAGSALAGSALAGSSGFVSAGIGALAGKAAAGLAAAALVTAGAVAVDHSATRSARHRTVVAQTQTQAPAAVAQSGGAPVASATSVPERRSSSSTAHRAAKAGATKASAALAQSAVLSASTAGANTAGASAALPGRTQTQSDPTVLPPAAVPVAADPTVPTTVVPTPVVTDPSAPTASAGLPVSSAAPIDAGSTGTVVDQPKPGLVPPTTQGSATPADSGATPPASSTPPADPGTAPADTGTAPPPADPSSPTSDPTASTPATPDASQADTGATTAG